MLRRAAVMVAGLVMATSFGVAGAGVASAVSPANNIKAHSIWTVEVKNDGCELVQFTLAGHTFVSDLGGDAGTFTGGGSTATFTMSWTTGSDTGLTFSGHFVSSPKEFKGTFGGIVAGLKGKVVLGEVGGC